MLNILPNVAHTIALASWVFRAAAMPRIEALNESMDLQIMTNNGLESAIRKRGDISSSVGLGNYIDLLYTVPIQLDDRVFAVHLDTGSSDLWVVSDKCVDNKCNGADVPRYPNASFVSTGVGVEMHYGDSTTGTYASGTVGLATASVAGVTMLHQVFALINDTTNDIVEFNASGIFGLGFPAASKIQELLTHTTGPLVKTDSFVKSIDTSGSLLSRMAMSGALDLPMFSVQFQRDAIDVDGRGSLTIGQLPDGVVNSSLTWVPVRLYPTADGGLAPPSFAPNEIYPYRWEVEIDGVLLDGTQLADSTIPANGIRSKRVSALIDTGNSLLRGPEDVVKNVLSLVSTTYDADASDPVAALPCNVPHSLAFQIAGKMFPIDPRDFISQLDSQAVMCQADNLVATDPPSVGSLFQWSLGTPFFKSNIVAFYYGNLTHPSVDPPRIGFLSAVPENANQLLQDAVRNATLSGGNFPDSVEPAPTASAALQHHITVSGGAKYVSTPTSTREELSRQSTRSRTVPTGSLNKKAAGVGCNIASSRGYLFLFSQTLGLLLLWT